MANKQFLIDNLAVNIYKRRGNRNLRLSVNASGQVRVSIPTWAPYSAGLQFARSRLSWIKSQRLEPGLIVQGQPVGKAHRIYFVPTRTNTKVTTKVSANLVQISHPIEVLSTDSDVQASARRAAERALKLQAERLLPQRLNQLALKHGFEYQSVAVKRLKSRWGSCDQNKKIVLNLFLMQLPWDLIDYVLLHELTHTDVLRHGPPFWLAMQRVLPHAQLKRKQLREFRPVLAGLN